MIKTVNMSKQSRRVHKPSKSIEREIRTMEEVKEEERIVDIKNQQEGMEVTQEKNNSEDKLKQLIMSLIGMQQEARQETNQKLEDTQRKTTETKEEIKTTRDIKIEEHNKNIEAKLKETKNQKQAQMLDMRSEVDNKITRAQIETEERFAEEINQTQAEIQII